MGGRGLPGKGWLIMSQMVKFLAKYEEQECPREILWWSFFFFLMYFIYLSLDALGLCGWAQVFSSCSGRGFLLAVHMPYFAEHSL